MSSDDIQSNYIASASTELSEEQAEILEDLLNPMELHHVLVTYMSSPERLFTFSTEKKRDAFVEMIVEDSDVERAEMITNFVNYTDDDMHLFVVH